MKKIFLLITILLLTGCNAKYQITINEDLTIVEEAELSGTESFYETYYKSTKSNVLNTIIDSYKDILNENGYIYELKEESEPFVKVRKEFKNIPLYIESTLLLNDYFDEIKYIEKDNIKRIETVGFNDNNSEDPNRFDIKNLEISIKCPFKVIESNAIRIDKKNNIYYYDLFKDNKIVLEYDTYSKYNPNEEMIRTALISLGVILGCWLTVLILNKKNKN